MDDNNSDAGESMHDEHVHTDGQANTHAEPAASQTANDGVTEHKLYAILGYILPFLFFLPLVQDTSKHNAFARFHANQQLILLAVWLCLYILSTVLYSMFYMGTFAIMPLLNLAVLVLAIMGIIHAAQGEMKELPIVGKFKLIDKLFKK